MSPEEQAALALALGDAALLCPELVAALITDAVELTGARARREPLSAEAGGAIAGRLAALVAMLPAEVAAMAVSATTSESQAEAEQRIREAREVFKHRVHAPLN